VGAISPEKDAVVALHLAAQSSTLDEALAKATEQQSDVTFERFQVNGLPAARTRLTGSGRVTEVTLIEYQHNVYGVVGQSTDSLAKQYAPVFRVAAGSFRALRPSERKSIRESRLRVRPARARETPAEIAKRTSSSWDAEGVAIANGVELTDRFDASWPVKLALAQPYTRRSR